MYVSMTLDWAGSVLFVCGVLGQSGNYVVMFGERLLMHVVCCFFADCLLFACAVTLLLRTFRVLLFLQAHGVPEEPGCEVCC